MTATLTPPAAPEREAAFSFVLEHPAADPAEARRHFLAKLSVETDPADVWLDLSRGSQRLVIVDARAPADHEQCHVPGALSLPHRAITAESTAHLPREKTVVVYCWGPGCNAATKAAARLAGLGFRVKEMIGGLEYWRREGHPVEGTDPENAPLAG